MPTKARTAGHPVRRCVIVAVICVLTVAGYTIAKTLPVSAAPRSPTIAQVRQAQFVLVSHGYVSVGPVDGILGRQTQRAVRQWQHANGLIEDGIPGPVTLASLLHSIDVASGGAPAVRVDPPAPPPATSVEEIIRAVWPDELENRAVAIATRESNLLPWVINRNRDATGLFQIMWSVHRGWLCPQLGICAQSQLQDADTNSRAAYALYQRDRGWGPWAT